METLQRTANRGSISTGGYEIDNSLKFEADNSEYLNRTPTANGSRTTWTTSVWVKRTELGVDQAIFSSVNSSSTTNFCRFTSNDEVRFYFQPDTAAITYSANTKAVFRDTSAWYHIVWGLDSTNSDGSKRFVVYVNGVYQESTWGGSATEATNCPLNQGSRFLQSEPIQIGEATYTNGQYFSGYMSELYILDGIAPDPTDFGEYDEDSGIWKPKAYAGSYGNQGCYLNFDDSASLGADSSGNGNNFTLNNITAADQATDTPTNNFCTLNVISAIGDNTYTEGATKGIANSLNEQAEGTFMINKGKWYFEAQNITSGGAMFGFGKPNNWATNHPNNNPGNDTSSFAIANDGNVYYNSNIAASGWASYATTDKAMIAVDLDNGFCYFGKNGTWGNSGDPTSGATGTGGFNYVSLVTNISLGDELVPALRISYSSLHGAMFNFGGYTVMSISSPASDESGYGTFEYAPPSGYYALCTKNLAEFG